MEIGVIEFAIAVVSGGIGSVTTGVLTYKFFADKLSVMEASMSKMQSSEKCEMKHRAWEDKCGMIHGNLRETMDRIDKKFDEICDQIEGLRTDRKHELKELTDLVRELLNDGGKKK